MNQTQFVTEVFEIASQYNPALAQTSSFQDVLKDFGVMKDNALKYELFLSSYRREPQLPRINQCDI